VTLARVTTPTDARSRALEELLAPVLAAVAEHRPEEDTALIRRAADTAIAAHEGQFRRSGEPYITHPMAVATIVAGLGLDAPTIAAALLHDAVEDTGVTLSALESEFGPVVARVVDGVTKLDRLQFDSKEAQQAATIRKMLVAMASDWRVLLIKLAETLRVDLGELSGNQERQLELGLREALSDPLLGAEAVPEAEIAAMAAASPNAARGVLALYRAWRVADHQEAGGRRTAVRRGHLFVECVPLSDRRGAGSHLRLRLGHRS